MAALTCRHQLLRFFPRGFRDETFLDWERSYKWQTHARWQEALGRDAFRSLLRRRRFSEIAVLAVRTISTLALSSSSPEGSC